MKIIFMGTPGIAVPSLKALYEKGYEIPFAITQPDKPKGRGNAISAPPVKEYALSKGIPVLQPERIKNNTEIYELLKSAKPDFYAVAAYGKILPREILDIPSKAPVNVHFSLLPRYRGAAPVNRAILAGDRVSGVSTMLMDAGTDTGDILLMKEVPIAHKNAMELSDELAMEGAELLIKTLENFDIITPLKQDDTKATSAPMMTKEEGRIDWMETAEEIERKIRAFFPWPAAYASLNGKTVKFFAAEIVRCDSDGLPGTVAESGKDSLVIRTGSGCLSVKELQIEGKKRLDVKSFLAGCPLEAGVRFE